MKENVIIVGARATVAPIIHNVKEVKVVENPAFVNSTPFHARPELPQITVPFQQKKKEPKKIVWRKGKMRKI